MQCTVDVPITIADSFSCSLPRDDQMSENILTGRLRRALDGDAVSETTMNEKQGRERYQRKRLIPRYFCAGGNGNLMVVLHGYDSHIVMCCGTCYPLGSECRQHRAILWTGCARRRSMLLEAGCCPLVLLDRLQDRR